MSESQRHTEHYLLILGMFETRKWITNRDAMAVLGISSGKVSDKLSRLRREGYLEAEGRNQDRRYFRTNKEYRIKTGPGIDDSEFTWLRDPSNFQMRVSR